MDFLQGQSETENLMDQTDSSAITNAVMRLQSLVNKASRLRSRFMRELESTVNFLKYHFNQRALFDKKVEN